MMWADRWVTWRSWEQCVCGGESSSYFENHGLQRMHGSSFIEGHMQAILQWEVASSEL